VSVCPLAQSARGRIEVRPFGSPGRTDQLADFAKVAEFQRRNVDCPFCASPPAMLVDADLEPPGRPARVRDGVLVTLPDQDRSAWISDQIEEGHALVRQCLALNRPGPYQIQAAINAVHTDAPDASSVDWSQVVVLYDQLAALTPSPIVALNRAVAVAELDGPQVALAIVDDLDLGSYHAFHATRADLLRRLGRYDEAREATARRSR
jgi:RNA polymerase sigma-70 factor, ECF subfamily